MARYQKDLEDHAKIPLYLQKMLQRQVDDIRKPSYMNFSEPEAL